MSQKNAEEREETQGIELRAVKPLSNRRLSLYRVGKGQFLLPDVLAAKERIELGAVRQRDLREPQIGRPVF